MLPQPGPLECQNSVKNDWKKKDMAKTNPVSFPSFLAYRKTYFLASPSFRGVHVIEFLASQFRVLSLFFLSRPLLWKHLRHDLKMARLQDEREPLDLHQSWLEQQIALSCVKLP